MVMSMNGNKIDKKYLKSWATQYRILLEVTTNNEESVRNCLQSQCKIILHDSGCSTGNRYSMHTVTAQCAPVATESAAMLWLIPFFTYLSFFRKQNASTTLDVTRPPR